MSRPITLAILIFSLLSTPPARAADPTLQKWAAETLSKIDAGFWMPQASLYALETNNNKRPRPAWVWDASIQLGALCSAARPPAPPPPPLAPNLPPQGKSLRHRPPHLPHHLPRPPRPRRQPRPQAP